MRFAALAAVGVLLARVDEKGALMLSVKPMLSARSTVAEPVVDTRRGAGLSPIAVANAGVFAALAVVVVSIGAFLPHLGAIELLSVVPFAIVGLRHRVRAVVAAAIAAGFVAFLVAGATATVVVAGCAVLGGLCGAIRRHGRGFGTVALVSCALAPLSALVVVGALEVFSAARDLAVGSLRASLVGLGRLAERIPGAQPIVHDVETVGDALLRFWPLTVSAVVVLAVPVGMLATNALVVLVARRVEWLAHTDPLEHVVYADAAMDAPIAPLPLEFVGVGFRHGGRSERDALVGVDLTVAPGEFIAVVGANGAGKSTLVSLLAGAAPTSGCVRRPGRVGLGLSGGTAVVAQRAETQAIGSTVGADLRWGLPQDYPIDVEKLLAAVGLDGFVEASTESLSGGQLQRLAIANALARRPALLISDESTSMLDTVGRAEILDLLAELPSRTGIAVVHVTHDPTEAARADRVIALDAGRIVDRATVDNGPEDLPQQEEDAAAVSAAGLGKPVLRLRGVGHRFDPGTPWEVTALRSVDLDVYEGEGLLITGENGSGKTTLAWVLAGLIRPTEGSALIDGAVASESVGAVALSFQHARLQLQRPTVAEDILAAAGFSASTAADADEFVAASLQRVGLPADLADHTIDELSGGQMRRVAIAGLLASRPRVLILDEPLAGLDRESRRALLEQLGRMRREQGLTLVIVSHDFEDTGLACTRTIEVTNGRVEMTGRGGELAEPSGITKSPAARPRRAGLILRAVPGTSALHRLGAATKLLTLAGATIVSLLLPGWPTIVVLSIVLVAAVALARLPWAVVPRLSWWVVATVLVGGAITAIGSGLGLFARSMLLTVLFLALSLLTVWTTRVEELPEAFVRIARPLRRVGAPVDEWAHTVMFAVRTLPLLREEFRVLLAARRLRPSTHAAGRTAQMVKRCREVVDLTVAVVISSGRRASDLGRAATLRGGFGGSGQPPRRGGISSRRDVA